MFGNLARLSLVAAALLLIVPEHLERVAHGTQPETGGGSTPTGPVLAPLTPLAYGPQYGISR